MDKGTWIAVVILLFAAAGFYLLQVENSTTPTTPSISSNAPTETAGAQTDTASMPDTNDQDCQAIATQAAQNNQASQGNTTAVVETHFNQKLQQCYYEIDIFITSGDQTAIKVAPHDQTVASCTTTSAGGLSCQDQSGNTITEPQFKALLARYFAN